MDINKYIENTKRKTAKAKLPALSTMNPVVLPDGGAGIATFNASFGEDLSNKDIETIKSEIIEDTYKFLLSKGFEQDELDKIVSFDFEESEYLLGITITADLTISSLRELADTLYPTVEKYDDETYFDISTSNSISVDIDMGKTLTERLHELDQMGMEIYCENYDFEALYESAKTKLDARDRSKLQKFIQTTDDPEEVNTYMKGLLLEEDDVVEEQGVVDPGILEQIYDAYNELSSWINRLTIEANSAGNDTLRNSADIAAGALDEFSSCLQEIQEDFQDISFQTKKKKFDAQKYVNMFLENYKTKEEFEDATGLDYLDYNIFDVVFDWIMNDVDDGTMNQREAEEITEEIAQEATEMILKEQ